MKLKMKGLSLLLGCLAISGSVFADDSVAPMHRHHYSYKGEGDYKGMAVAPEAAKTRNHFEIIGALGVAKLSANNSTLGVTSSEIDTLVQTNSGSWNTFAGQLGLGYIYYFRNARPYSDSAQWFTSVEPQVNIYHLASNSVDGDVWRFESSDFNQMTYDIPVHSTRLMLDATLSVLTWKKLSVYAKGGIGNAWNRIGYSDTDNADDSGIVNQRLDLNNRTNTKFVWEAGAGLLYDFNKRVGLSLEYLYANLGKVKTAAAGNTGTITEPVIVPARFNLKSQAVLLGLHIAL